MTDEHAPFIAVATGGKYVDPETGARYWWPDEPGADAPTGTVPDGWKDVGYVTEDQTAEDVKRREDEVEEDKDRRDTDDKSWPPKGMETKVPKPTSGK